jgi:predicted glycosyltransferase
MVGTDYSITHVGKLLGIESIVFNEDDYNINKLFCKLAYPFATKIVSPLVCDVGKYSHKKVAYDGFQKLAYLHPSYFQPDMKVVKKYFDSTKKTYLIRIVQFSAGHDIEMNHSGISIQLLEKICTILEKQGQVYISSESRLPDHLQKYKLEINPKDIHHLLSFVDIFIADSQSMIVEAAMLGTPCIRFNSFVGKISVLEELEKKYKLAIGVHSCEPHELVRQLKLLLTQEDIKCVYNRRRDKMLKDKIDLTVFAVKLFHNYPQSISKK